MSFHLLVALRPDATQLFLVQVAKHLDNEQFQSGVSSIMVQTAEQKKAAPLQGGFVEQPGATNAH